VSGLADQNYEVIVIGGGFYGCCIALFLRHSFQRIAIIEKEADLLTRASYLNQARVHHGYHYPRNIITALRSSINFPRFVFDFRHCIDGSFTMVYAIARNNSKVSAFQFRRFCESINAPIKQAPQSICNLFNRSLIEAVFTVREYALNAVKLRQWIKQHLEAAGIHVLFRKKVQRVTADQNDHVAVVLDTGECLVGQHVFNCTYSQINTLLRNSGIPLLPLKHELAEMALIEVPDELKRLGITVMDGPFFATFPFPPRSLHSLSHVRYTPHTEWYDEEYYRDAHHYLETAQIQSRSVFMLKDAQRYLPLLREARHVESLFEIKTLWAQNEIDDGRPIVFRKDHGVKNFSTIMGGKIDNIYDIIQALREFQAYCKDTKSSQSSWWFA